MMFESLVEAITILGGLDQIRGWGWESRTAHRGLLSRRRRAPGGRTQASVSALPGRQRMRRKACGTLEGVTLGWSGRFRRVNGRDRGTGSAGHRLGLGQTFLLDVL